MYRCVGRLIHILFLRGIFFNIQYVKEENSRKSRFFFFKKASTGLWITKQLTLIVEDLENKNWTKGSRDSCYHREVIVMDIFCFLSYWFTWTCFYRVGVLSFIFPFKMQLLKRKKCNYWNIFYPHKKHIFFLLVNLNTLASVKIANRFSCPGLWTTV